MIWGMNSRGDENQTSFAKWHIAHRTHSINVHTFLAQVASCGEDTICHFPQKISDAVRDGGMPNLLPYGADRVI